VLFNLLFLLLQCLNAGLNVSEVHLVISWNLPFWYIIYAKCKGLDKLSFKIIYIYDINL